MGVNPGPIGQLIGKGIGVSVACFSYAFIFLSVLVFIILFFFLIKKILQNSILRFIFSFFLAGLIAFGLLILLLKTFPQEKLANLLKFCFYLFSPELFGGIKKTALQHF